MDTGFVQSERTCYLTFMRGLLSYRSDRNLQTSYIANPRLLRKICPVPSSAILQFWESGFITFVCHGHSYIKDSKLRSRGVRYILYGSTVVTVIEVL
jgi:hypothetical protein